MRLLSESAIPLFAKWRRLSVASQSVAEAVGVFY